MGLQHKLNVSRGIQASATGRYFVEVERPEKSRVTAGGRVEIDEVPYQIFKLYTKKDEKFQASMRVQSQPGCCGIAIFYQFTGDPAGVAKLVEFGVMGAMRSSYGMVSFTLKEGSGILESFPATPDDIGEPAVDPVNISHQTFRNAKTNNMLVNVSIDLRQPAASAGRPDHLGGE